MVTFSEYSDLASKPKKNRKNFNMTLSALTLRQAMKLIIFL